MIKTIKIKKNTITLNKPGHDGAVAPAAIKGLSGCRGGNWSLGLIMDIRPQRLATHSNQPEPSFYLPPCSEPDCDWLPWVTSLRGSLGHMRPSKFSPFGTF